MKFPRYFFIVMPLLVLFCTSSVASVDENTRLYEASYFQQFAPQTALEMVVRIPGFVLQEADEDRGLSQGGTNVLLNRQPIIGKGETATLQIEQIAATSVVGIEVIDAGTLDLPGFNGLVANIITTQTTIAGTMLWEPQWRRNNDPALLNGNISFSGNQGNLDFSGALTSTMVRASFMGPETVYDADGVVFETREERLSIEGNQPALSGSLRWDLADNRTLNAKASVVRLDLDRPQVSQTQSVTPRGITSLNQAKLTSGRTSMRVDTDYSFPAFGGRSKVIGFATRQRSDATTRATIEQDSVGLISNQRFNERSTRGESIARFEQIWDGQNQQSWQLAVEGALNRLDLSTDFAVVDSQDAGIVLAQSITDTSIKERRAELTLAHRRKLSPSTDIQVSVGAETSTIEQGMVKRSFDRPKGFVSINATPNTQWTFSARASREIGQINFRDFAASVSLIEEVVTENNPELVPEQSWSFTARAERRFDAGHVASLELGHDQIDDLVDRIPLGESGDAIGNIAEATRNRITGVLTLVGAPFGVAGARLDFRGTWQQSSVLDPIEGFDRDIGRLLTRDVRVEFRHDIAATDFSYGFVLQSLDLAPSYRSTFVQYQNIPGGGLTPGENSVFIEHKDLFGVRLRATLSELLGQTARFSRVIHAGRRDVSAIDRVERRARGLNGPFLSLSLSKAF